MTRSGALEPRERPDPRSSERRVAAVIVVDDLTRPTPDGTPRVLQELADAGIPPDARIPAERVTILIATGTHDPPGDGPALRRKLGDEGMGVGFWSTTTEAGSRRPRRA
jgi:Lactate racemase N-terminal domain